MSANPLELAHSEKPKSRADSSGRYNTSIRFSPELHERLRVAAEKRNLSMNTLVVKAVEDFLPRLIPADELRLTR